MCHIDNFYAKWIWKYLYALMERLQKIHSMSDVLDFMESLTNLVGNALFVQSTCRMLMYSSPTKFKKKI